MLLRCSVYSAACRFLRSFAELQRTTTYCLIGQIAVLALIIAHESVMLRAIKAALRYDERSRPELWVFNVLIESQLPTVALFVLLLDELDDSLSGLVAPAIVIYFLFITLSTLRLRPSLTLMTGLLSAARLSLRYVVCTTQI